MEAEKIPIDDQHALMAPHPELFEDAFHFNQAGSAIMGVQAAASIRRALETPEASGPAIRRFIRRNLPLRP